MELGVLFVVGLFGFYLIVLPILVFTARGRLTRLEAEANSLREQLAALKARGAGGASAAAASPESETGRPFVPTPEPSIALSAAGIVGAERGPAPTPQPGLHPGSMPGRPVVPGLAAS